ncbi:unnamed protein product [Ceutorhynchus assimilis]|uniref:Regulatory protein zeste n=1 Tax=Ceutorhynchus assimilis TaxID=467358 RepID=A0A9N9MDU7_9CUCU|nr:unnamed protein product [Ceutorhynchus assimilis]
MDDKGEKKMAKRAPNFTNKEEVILMGLVKAYKHVLENKQTDSNFNKKKQECWREITSRFNSQSGEVYRVSVNLRKKYENLKKKTCKKLRESKTYVMGTGTGTPKSEILSEIDVEIRDILGVRVEGLNSEFGGDAQNNELDVDKSRENLNVDNQVDDTIDKIDTLEKNTPWAKNMVQSLRTPKSRH